MGNRTGLVGMGLAQGLVDSAIIQAGRPRPGTTASCSHTLPVTARQADVTSTGNCETSGRDKYQ